jgi:cyclase
MTPMPLAKRIIPCLDIQRGRVVKGTHFEGLRYAGDPVELSRRYRDDGADEIVFLDITASLDRRKTLSSLVRRIAANLDVPFTVGGGIRTVNDARSVLCNGADKVSVNTAVLERPRIVKDISRVFGSQCVMVAIDAKRVRHNGISKFKVFSHSGTRQTKNEAAAWAKRIEMLGAGELLVTSIDRDGTKLGYDLELLSEITSAVNLPVIASGGCGELRHFRDVLVGADCDAALAASLFHYRQLSIRDVKEYLTTQGVWVRP